MNAPDTIKQPLPPFRYAGGDLGLNSDNGMGPWIYFVDHAGQKWLTHSVETLLRNIDQFEEGGPGGREQLLAWAARHYGMDVWALIKGRDFQLRAQVDDRATNQLTEA